MKPGSSSNSSRESKRRSRPSSPTRLRDQSSVSSGIGFEQSHRVPDSAPPPLSSTTLTSSPSNKPTLIPTLILGAFPTLSNSNARKRPTRSKDESPTAGAGTPLATLSFASLLVALVVSVMIMITFSPSLRVSGRDMDLLELSAYGNVRRGPDSGGCRIQ